jgi:hypothetical protein
MRSYEINLRPTGGYRLALLEDGLEMGGGVFEEASDAWAEGQCWEDADRSPCTVDGLSKQIDELLGVVQVAQGLKAENPGADVLSELEEFIPRLILRIAFLREARDSLAAGKSLSASPLKH